MGVGWLASPQLLLSLTTFLLSLLCCAVVSGSGPQNGGFLYPVTGSSLVELCAGWAWPLRWLRLLSELFVFYLLY